MFQLGPLSFVDPWILLALVSLPLLWWLLRATPPAPKRLSFPAIRLLMGLKPREETPAHTPWWLILLRLAIAALLILGLARPLMNPTQSISGSGDLLLVIDDGWSAARGWRRHLDALDASLAAAEREGRAVALLTTAPAADGSPAAVSNLMPASDARALVKGLEPKAWAGDREAAAAALDALPREQRFAVLWANDGLEAAGTLTLAKALLARGKVTLLRDELSALARVLLPPVSEGAALSVTVLRADPGAADSAVVVAEREDGREVVRIPVEIAAGETSGEGSIDLPTELRNEIDRLRLDGEESAGALVLLDERWRRRPVGLLDESGGGDDQPLLSELFYIEKALEPFAAVTRNNLTALLAGDNAVIILPDQGALAEEDIQALDAFIRDGGLVLRFAGPRLAENFDSLLPVTLRGGGRTLGGVMTWDTPASLAAFTPEGPYADLPIPTDVKIKRQVLAEPTLDLTEKTWARLTDGTPLITAETRGKGKLVLVHTTANTEWSDLALSGLFVDLLRRTVAAAAGVTGQGDLPLPPLALSDGFGHLGAPDATATALAPGEEKVTPHNPPGYYGNDSERRALNLSTFVTELEPLGALPSGVISAPYQHGSEQELTPWLLGLALLLGLGDLLVALALRGLLSSRLRATAALLLVGLLAWSDRATADDSFALLAASDTRLAFVETGNDLVDDISRAGLSGLSIMLSDRTSVEAEAPMGIDLEHDDILFFSLIYWPVDDSQADLSPAAAAKVNDYLQNGGTIIFDLREPSSGNSLYQTRGMATLQRLLAKVEIPPLVPLPADHVLTRAFYLMQQFPGRYAEGAIWVDSAETGAHDGVASVIVGSNDWAAAWALTEDGRPMFALVPGTDRQRELAYRFGINLVMYALTGNYKSDQVHVPFILERLGE